MQPSASNSSRSARSPSAQHNHSASGSSTDTTMTSQSSAPRSSSSSARSHSSRSTVPNGQISQIEKSVTHLLVATKQLLETLTQWSRRQVSENEVSDVYVRLGYEFNLASRAFNAIGVDVSDLGPVPDLLRTILEDTLSQEASPQSLDVYLPRIRDIIINLLHGLKRKQARLRSRQQKDDKPLPGRQASAGSVAGEALSYEDAPGPASPKRPGRTRYDSSGSLDDKLHGGSRSSPDIKSGSYSDREASRREAQNALTQPAQQESEMTSRGSTLASNPTSYPPPPPPPPPKQDDAIGALQRSGELERRASRRFSAYQIQKHLGASSNGVPVIPTQNSPIPNRGRDVRESLSAVRKRGSYVHRRQRSTNRSRGNIDDKATQPQQQQQQQPTTGNGSDGDSAKARAEAPSTDGSRTNDNEPRPDKDVPNGLGEQPPVLPPMPQEPSLADAFEPVKNVEASPSQGPETPRSSHRQPNTAAVTPPQSSQYSPEQPSPGKELTLFLQYRSKIKKYVLPEGSTGLTIGRLQLAFIEKFAWNTHNNGVDLPEIYIQDSISGIRHELEDLNDVKDRSVLVLNVDALDEVKKHFDDEFGGVRRLLESVKGALDGQGNMMQRVSDRQLDAVKEIARLAAAPSVSAPSVPASGDTPRTPISGGSSQMAEISSLRRDLAVLRQTYTDFSADIASSMGAIRSKADTVKASAADASVPSYEGNAGRARISQGKKELAEESERLVARVDDLQDLIEDLRKDVVSRGVRPLPRQLESVGKDVSNVTKEIKKMQDFLQREKPIWTKIWEKELQLVCEERDQLTMQEDLAADLQDDLEKAAQTFALVEQATKQQAMANGNSGPTLRNVSRNVVIDPAVDPVKAKDGVLDEVRALQPNHESRLEAIERAEKARQKELETRRVGLFQKELGKFVEEGKLKKSGGFEETERLRQVKDERNRKEMWNIAQARAAEIAKAEAEAQAQQSSTTEAETAENASAESTDEPSSPKGKAPVEEDDDNAGEAKKEEEEEEEAPADKDKPESQD